MGTTVSRHVPPLTYRQPGGLDAIRSLSGPMPRGLTITGGSRTPEGPKFRSNHLSARTQIALGYSVLPAATKSTQPLTRLRDSDYNLLRIAMIGMCMSVSDDPKQLVLAAFAVARDSGKTDWQRMQLGVLKNRLLLLTDRRFDEAQYGAINFQGFVRGLSDLLRIDTSTYPPTAELIVPEAIEADRAKHYGSRVRPDLWRAFLDFSSGSSYVWDRNRGEAREGEATEELPAIDTILPEVLDEWRREFVDEKHGEIQETARDLGRVLEWRDHRLGTRHLPLKLRGEWNRFVREKVVALIREWFQRKDMPAPEDMLLEVPHERGKKDTAAYELREFLATCIRSMTEDELSKVSIPASAIARLFSQSRSGK